MPDLANRIDIEPPEGLGCDQLVRLLSAMVAVAHGPARFTNSELECAFGVWNELLTTSPDLHRQRPEFFAFHQALLVERDYRDSCSNRGAA